jgi:hypothetical protein
MAYSANDLAALETAIATGALRVKQGNEEVQYRSLSEMMAVRRMMQAELTPGSRKASVSYPVTGRGV